MDVKGRFDANLNKHRRSKIKSAVAIALVLIIFIAMAAGCSETGPAETPGAGVKPEETPPVTGAKPEETPPVTGAKPEETPAVIEDDPEPEIDTSLDWERVEVNGLLSVEIKKDWFVEYESERTICYFDQNSELPNFIFFNDSVSGYLGRTDEEIHRFFDWWLKERFNSPEISVIRQEYTIYNDVKGLEVVFDDVSDNGDPITRHSFYTLIETTYIALTFRFEQGGEAPHLDDVNHVLNSIRSNNIEFDRWPVSHLPKDIPVYPGADIETEIWSSNGNDLNVDIYIKNSSPEALQKYIEALSDAGWEISPVLAEDTRGEGYKGASYFYYIMNGTTAYLHFSFSE